MADTRPHFFSKRVEADTLGNEGTDLIESTSPDIADRARYIIRNESDVDVALLTWQDDGAFNSAYRMAPLERLEFESDAKLTLRVAKNGSAGDVFISLIVVGLPTRVAQITTEA
jgi:hypothetical protein